MIMIQKMEQELETIFMLQTQQFGHVKALEKLNNPGVYIHNLGTGHAYSVLDIVKNFEKVNNVKVNYKIVDRRAGDLAEYYADPSKALQQLEWKTEKTIEDICRDAWNYEKNNVQRCFLQHLLFCLV